MIAAVDGIREAGKRVLTTDQKREWFATDELRATAVLTGIIAGLAGGLAGSWVMNRFHSLMSSASDQRSSERERHRRRTGGAGDDGPAAKEQGKRATDSDGGQEPATVQVAEAVSRTVAQHELTSGEKRVAGPAVHYAYGAAVGGLYGGLVEAAPVVGSGFGTAYGTALWLVGDEIAIPGLGLGKSPAEVAAGEHAQAMAAHLVYGVTLEGVRRLVRRSLQGGSM